MNWLSMNDVCQIERFHSRDKPPYCFAQTKDNSCLKIEFNSQRTGLVHQYGRLFFVLEHQYGHRDFARKRCMRKLSILARVSRVLEFVMSSSLES